MNVLVYCRRLRYRRTVQCSLCHVGYTRKSDNDNRVLIREILRCIGT